MDLTNTFVVPADINTTWRALQDVEALAPCMPGATLETHDGDDLTGKVKVRLGPVSQVYGGKATFVSRDESEHRLVIEGTGKETRGAGTAQGKVVATLVAESPDRTRVDVVTELAITGKAAQFGRGVMQDVASRIIDQFSANLAALITTVAAAGAPSPDETEGAATPVSPVTAPRPSVKQEDSIDLLGTAGAPVLKRALPLAIGVVVVVVVIVWVARRR